MYELISVARYDLDISNSYHFTEDEAYNAMVGEMLTWTAYNTIEEIQLAAKRGECELARKGAWAETHETGTCTWKIVEVPDKKCLLTEKYERKEIVMPTFEIYYSDLNEAAQKRLLEAVNVDSASDMNWDCDILPIALFEFEKEGNEYFSSSSGKIQQFLASKEDSYAILQLRYSDETASERFMSLKSLEKMKLKPVFEHYEVTYVSPLPPYEDRNEMLEKLYMQFNVSRPDDFKGHSLSVSDIIALRENGVVTCHFVDSIGFKELPRFFKPALQ